jgi:hypothetical protein
MHHLKVQMKNGEMAQNILQQSMDALGTCLNLNNGVPINDEVDLGIQMLGVLNDAWQACGVAMDKYLQKCINVNPHLKKVGGIIIGLFI